MGYVSDQDFSVYGGLVAHSWKLIQALVVSARLQCFADCASTATWGQEGLPTAGAHLLLDLAGSVLVTVQQQNTYLADPSYLCRAFG